MANKPTNSPQNDHKNIQFIHEYYENVDFSIKNIYNYIVIGGIYLWKKYNLVIITIPVV